MENIYLNYIMCIYTSTYMYYSILGRFYSMTPSDFLGYLYCLLLSSLLVYLLFPSLINPPIFQFPPSDHWQLAISFLLLPQTIAPAIATPLSTFLFSAVPPGYILPSRNLEL